MEELNRRIKEVLREKGRCIISIDGRCASGKSTLGRKLSEEWNGNLFHMDDFFLRPEQRTPERYQTPGENVDHERFLEEVLIPLSEKRDFSYVPFDCDVMKLSDHSVPVKDLPVAVIEGSYSQRDDLRKYYDINAVIDIDPQLQLERLAERNPQKLQMFIDRWIPLEEMYFQTYRIYERADIVLHAEKNGISL